MNVIICIIRSSTLHLVEIVLWDHAIAPLIGALVVSKEVFQEVDNEDEDEIALHRGGGGG